MSEAILILPDAFHDALKDLRLQPTPASPKHLPCDLLQRSAADVAADAYAEEIPEAGGEVVPAGVVGNKGNARYWHLRSAFGSLSL